MVPRRLLIPEMMQLFGVLCRILQEREETVFHNNTKTPTTTWWSAQMEQALVGIAGTYLTETLPVGQRKPRGTRFRPRALS